MNEPMRLGVCYYPEHWPESWWEDDARRMAAIGISRAPAFVRRSALVLPAYALTILVWGTWVEVRLWLPMYPVILPLALSHLFPVAGDP